MSVDDHFAPAFPSGSDTYPSSFGDQIKGNGRRGITTRAYFAARAPHAVPEWFFPKMPSECPLVPIWNCMPDGPLKDEIRLHFLGDIEATSFEAAEWLLARGRKAAEQTEWQAEFKRQLVAQWPWAWADMVLKAGAQ